MLDGAEQRMNQILARLGPDLIDSSTAPINPGAAANSPESFKAMVSLMQSQMLASAFDTKDNDDNNNNNSSMNMMMLMQQMPMANSLPMQMQQQMMMPMNLATSPINNNYPENNLYPKPVVMPVQGNISSEYGHRHHPISGKSHFHSGLDIAAPLGSAIRMPWDGKVVYVGHVSGFGDNTVIVAHENQVQENGEILYSVFGHNQNAMVRPGDQLRAGEIFATVGSEGNSTGPHLHWELRVARPGLAGRDIFEKHISKTIDPLPFIQA